MVRSPVVGGIGYQELIILGAIGASVLLAYVPGIWATFDAAMQPDSAWERADQDKRLWVLLPLVARFVCAPIATVAAAIYALRVRPKLRSGDPG